MGAAPIVLERAGRRFGRRRALEAVELELAPGEVLGLAGPNGSGKTTLIRLVAGFLKPTSGTVRVLGLDPYRDQARVMERARFAFAPPALYPSLTAREHLRFLSRIGRPAGERVRASDVDRALEDVGLAERADDRVATYSFGMRQRLVVAQALLPTPELLVLDEPTDGLDPRAVIELRGVLRRLRTERGTAILLSSHLLIEVERLVDRMLILSEGRALFLGRPAELTGGHSSLRLSVRDPRRALTALAQRGLPAVETQDGEVELTHGALDLASASALMRTAGTELEGYRVHRPTLEEALLRRLHEGEAQSE